MKKIKKSVELLGYGSILFGVGILLALVSALFNIQNPTINKVIIGTLLIIGVVIGLLNITKDETVSFLISILVLVLLVGPLLGVLTTEFGLTGPLLTKVFSNLITLLVPAAIIVALKTIVLDAKDE